MEYIVIKERIKKGIILLIAASSILTGCGEKNKNENIITGMEQIKSGNYEEALESFDAAMVYNEDNELIYRGQGIAYMGMYQYEDAIECFLKSFSYANGNVNDLAFDTNYYLASAYYKIGKYQEAQDVYSAILAADKKATDAYYLRGCTNLQLGFLENAIKDFDMAISLSENQVDVLLDAYQEMESTGFKQEGQAYIQAYLTQNETIISNDKKGMIYYYLEDYANARNYLDGALNTGDAKVSLILGKTYEKLGTIDYAIVVYQTYLESNEADAAIYDRLGVCFMQQKKYADALQAFQNGVELGNSSYIQNLRFHTIIANEYLGNFEQAKNLMEEYLQSYPNDEVAIRENDFLQTR